MPAITKQKKTNATKLSKGVSAHSGLTLDQDEVMKSMMAARKAGKQRESSLEQDDSGSDTDGLEGEASDTGEESDAGVSSASGESSRAGRKGSKRPKSSQGPANSPWLEPRPLVTPPTSNTPSSRVNPTARQSIAISPPPPSKPPTTTTFASLGLSQTLISSLESINIRKPTEIQAACVGPIMSGRDCLGGAKTGSGKTLAFALPIVERISRDPYGIWAVVLTPTRELAYQLTEQFLAVGRPLGLTTVTIVGGMDMMTQAKELEARPHIVVATPGRLCDLLRSEGGSLLSRVKVLVLDEADRMLTPTFAPELGYLFQQMPANRQTCLFTATVSEPLLQLANKAPLPGKLKPFVHRVESDTLTVSGLKQKYLFIPSQVRDPYLYHLLLHPPTEIDAALRARRSKKTTDDPDDETNDRIPSTTIFTQRCATAHLLHLLLTQLEIPSVPLHSHLTQPQRLKSLARFRAQEVPVLVTTDVGSRGLDIPEVAMVLNWDCPRRSDDYVHRVGRTARAGRGGVAITVVTERDVELVQMIEEEVGVKMGELELPEEEVLESLNKVSLARRMATMEMHDSGFGERQATNKAKAIKRARRDAKRI